MAQAYFRVLTASRVFPRTIFGS